jgi:acyl-CoA dehydrogenase
MTGGQEFNEVFFTDVRIPDSHRLDAPGQGWQVAIGTLMGERALGVAADVFGLQDATSRLIRQVRELGHPLDSGLRDQVAARWVQARIVQLMAQRADAKLRRGVPPGPEESVVKLGSTEAMRRLADTAAELLGPALVADTGEWSTTAWAGWTMHTAGCRIGAGSDEVMRNILAERVLGLPK